MKTFLLVTAILWAWSAAYWMDEAHEWRDLAFEASALATVVVADFERCAIKNQEMNRGI